MASANTVAAIYNSSQGNVTTESAFPALNPLGGGTTVNYATPSLGTTRAFVETTSNIFDGRPFIVQAFFKTTPGTSGNFTGKIYWNSGANTNLTTLTGDVLLISTGAVALGAQSASHYLSAVCLWDSVSLQLCSAQEIGLNNIVTTPAVTNSGAVTISATNPIKQGTSVGAVTNLQFFATALFGTGNAANAATLVELSINQL